MLYELPLRFSEEGSIDNLLQTMVDRLVEIIPSASRGALLLDDPITGDLLLKAQLPVGQPSINMALASLMMILRQGFHGQERLDPGRSQLVNQVSSGMYIPLIWKDRILGAACVDNDDGGSLFFEGLLWLMFAAGHYASMAIVQNNLQSELRRNSVLSGSAFDDFLAKRYERHCCRKPLKVDCAQAVKDLRWFFWRPISGIYPNSCWIWTLTMSWIY